MKCLVINKPYYANAITPRNLCIYELRKRHVTYKKISEQFDITIERARQIYLKMERLYLRGVFHYEDIN